MEGGCFEVSSCFEFSFRMMCIGGGSYSVKDVEVDEDGCN